jgi:hypothetical protein
MDNTNTAPNEKKTWTDTAKDVLHNPYVDVAIGAAAATAVFASRGRLLGVAEEYFPKAAELLGGFEKAEASAVASSGARALPKETSDLLMAQNPKELIGVAHSWQTSPAVLDRLADHFHPTILEAVASNKMAGTATIEKMMNSPLFTKGVADNLARNENATAAQLDRLAEDAPQRVAGHINTTPETLSRLVDKVRTQNLDAELEAHARSTQDWAPQALTEQLLLNPKTPVKSLEGLPFDHPRINLGYAGAASLRLAKSPATTAETLGKIDTVASRLEQNRFGGVLDWESASSLKSKIDEALSVHPNSTSAILDRIAKER